MRPRHGCMVGGRSYLRGGCRWEGQLSGETRDAYGISRQKQELLLGFFLFLTVHGRETVAAPSLTIATASTSSSAMSASGTAVLR